MYEAYELFCERLDSHGRGNIPPLNLEHALAILSNKIKRHPRVVEGTTGYPVMETPENILIDIANLAFVALLIRCGVWPYAER